MLVGSVGGTWAEDGTICADGRGGSSGKTVRRSKLSGSRFQAWFGTSGSSARNVFVPEVKGLFADGVRNHLTHRGKPMTDQDSLRYPIGGFQPRRSLSSEERENLISEIEHLPADLRFVVSGLDDRQLDTRWVIFLRNLTEEDFSRTINHPELGAVSLETNLQMYAWHGKHHLAHITGLAEREGW